MSLYRKKGTKRNSVRAVFEGSHIFQGFKIIEKQEEK
jgi:hypothetical protein